MRYEALERMAKVEAVIWRPAELGVVHHVVGDGAGSCIKSN